jgi:chromosome segregation ATPase
MTGLFSRLKESRVSRNLIKAAEAAARPAEAPILAGSPADHDTLEHGSLAGSRIATVRSEFERFSAAFSREIARFSALHSKLEADHGQLEKRYASLSAEHRQARENLEIAQSQAAAYHHEQLRLRNESTVLAQKLDALSVEVEALRGKSEHLQFRCDGLQTDYSNAVQECDRRDVSLIEARQELNDLTQNYETARIQIEQGRHRESELEARNVLLEIEVKELRPQVDHGSRQSVQQHERIVALEADLKAARSELSSRERMVAELQKERETLSANCNLLTARLDESLHASGLKVDALSQTKGFLWRMSEKQRKQIADQITRISRLEMTNSKLSQELLDASRIDGAESPGGETPTRPAGAKRGDASRAN